MVSPPRRGVRYRLYPALGRRVPRDSKPSRWSGAAGRCCGRKRRVDCEGSRIGHGMSLRSLNCSSFRFLISDDWPQRQ